MRRYLNSPVAPAASAATARTPRRHLLSLSVFLTATLASLTLSASTAQAQSCAGANVLPVLSGVPTAKAATLCLINGERAADGLAALSSEPALERAATAYSQAMVQRRFFGHVTPGGETIEQRLAGYFGSAGGGAMGENIAWGERTLATPASIVRSWMASPGHRQNILSPRFKEIGVGIAPGSPSGSVPAISATYTTAFGARSVPTSASSGPTATRVSASSMSPRTARAPKAKRISAKRKAQISKRCHRVAKRTKASRKTRAKRYDRCMRRSLRAAAR